ncbi:MAG: hypothetical protein QXS24_03065 [Desulfurococcaceae archaeon]
MNLSTLKYLVEKIAQELRRDNINISTCEIRDKKSRYEIYFRLDENRAELSKIKIIINKNELKIRVFTGKTSFDLRLKKLIKRELTRLADST